MQISGRPGLGGLRWLTTMPVLTRQTVLKTDSKAHVLTHLQLPYPGRGDLPVHVSMCCMHR